MKKSFLLFFILLSSVVTAQDNLYKKIKERLKAEHPEIKTENKLLVVNFWSIEDANSREANVQMNKAYTAYEYAKLKGGLKGMIGVMISLNEEISLNDITIGKDKVTKNISMVSSGLDAGNHKCIVYDSNGNVVKESAGTELFKEINQLITR
jgi:hypothetical protein